MQTIEVHVVGNLCFWGSFSLPQLVPTVNSFFTFNLCQLSTVSSRNFPVLVTLLHVVARGGHLCFLKLVPPVNRQGPRLSFL